MGDEVKKGDTLVVLEAMKMEYNVTAIEDGTVRAITVKKGQLVLQGSTLVILEVQS